MEELRYFIQRLIHLPFNYADQARCGYAPDLKMRFLNGKLKNEEIAEFFGALKEKLASNSKRITLIDFLQHSIYLFYPYLSGNKQIKEDEIETIVTLIEQCHHHMQTLLTVPNSKCVTIEFYGQSFEILGLKPSWLSQNNRAQSVVKQFLKDVASLVDDTVAIKAMVTNYKKEVTKQAEAASLQTAASLSHGLFASYRQILDNNQPSLNTVDFRSI